MAFLSRKICFVSHLITTQNALNRLIPPTVNVLQSRNYAARKGTRERKQKKKVKVEIQKIGFIPHNLRNRDKQLAERPSRKYDDSWKGEPVDNVYPMKYYKHIVHPFAEAIKAHRETHHPDMYNKPDSKVYATIELNMQGEKKTRFVDNFKRYAPITHKYDHGEIRTIIVFAKNEDSQKEALDAGAQLAGGVNLIKQIQNGQVVLHDFEHVIAHPDIMPELVALRGVMKRKFPSQRTDTLDINLGQLVDKFLYGIGYQAKKDEYEKDFGEIETVLGTLDMREKHLEENFAVLVRDVMTQKPKRDGPFITRCLIWSPPSREKLKVNHEVYFKEDTKSTKSKREEIVKDEAVAL